MDKETENSRTPKNFQTPPDALRDEKLNLILENELTEWRIVESLLPENPEICRRELYREFLFEDFKQVIDFIIKISIGCEIFPHHPRWENVWTSLRVYLTTWDARHIISYKDIMLARYMDKVYSEFSTVVTATRTQERKEDEVKTFVKQVQNYVSNDELEKAFDNLNKYITLNSEIDNKNEFILLMGQFNRYQKERRIGKLTKSEEHTEIAKITLSLLELIKTINK